MHFFVNLLLVFVVDAPVFSVLKGNSRLARDFLSGFSRRGERGRLQRFRGVRGICLRGNCRLRLRRGVQRALRGENVRMCGIGMGVRKRRARTGLMLGARVSRRREGRLGSTLIRR